MEHPRSEGEEQETDDDRSDAAHCRIAAEAIGRGRGRLGVPVDAGSALGCVREPRKPWQRILERAGIANLWIHDLRRSVGSWLGASGANAYTIARALGHQSVRSGEVYVRLHADPVRQAITAIQNSQPALDATVGKILGGSVKNAA